MHHLQAKYMENELVDIVGRENVLTNPSDLLFYGVDYMWVPRMYIDRGLIPPTPDLVVLPGSAQEVSQIVKLGNQYRVPIIPVPQVRATERAIVAFRSWLAAEAEVFARSLEALIADHEDRQRSPRTGGASRGKRR